jgi:hypothetical protein
MDALGERRDGLLVLDVERDRHRAPAGALGEGGGFFDLGSTGRRARGARGAHDVVSAAAVGREPLPDATARAVTIATGVRPTWARSLRRHAG